MTRAGIPKGDEHGQGCVGGGLTASAAGDRAVA